MKLNRPLESYTEFLVLSHWYEDNMNAKSSTCVRTHTAYVSSKLGMFPLLLCSCVCHTPELPRWFNELRLYIKVFTLKPVTISHMPFCSVLKTGYFLSKQDPHFYILSDYSWKFLKDGPVWFLGPVRQQWEEAHRVTLHWCCHTFTWCSPLAPTRDSLPSLLLLIVLLQPAGVGEPVWVDYFWHQLLT